MPPTITLLTQGNATVDSAVITTAAVTPAGSSLVLVCVHSIALAAPVDRMTSVVGNNITYVPVADVITNGATYTGRLHVWCGRAANPTNTTIVITNPASQAASAWAVLQCTDIETARIFGVRGISAIRQIGLLNSGSSGTMTTATVYLAEARSNNNAVVGIFTHHANEVTTPGTGLTELADQQNGDLANIEVSWAAPFTRRVSASWASLVTSFGAIALEIAEPNNVTFVPQPIDALYG